MGIINNILKFFGYIPKSEQVITELSDIWDRGYGISAPSYVEDYLDQYGDSGWVYACANRIAKKASSATMHMYNETASDQENEKQEVDHIFRDVLKNPNELLSEYELRFLLYLHMETAGEAFWYIAENEVGGPAKIYPLMPSFTKVVPGDDKLVKGYIYGKDSDRVSYDVNEVIHFKYPNPDPENFFRGASPVRAARWAIATGQKADEWNYNFFNNSAQPGGYLTTEKKLNETEVKRLIKMWEKHHQGVDKSHKVAVAQQGLEYKELGLSHDDMDFVNQLNNSRDKILAICGVPKSILGLVEDVNRANAQTDKENFAEQTIDPVNTLVASTLTQFLKINYDERLLVEFDTVAPADKKFLLDKRGMELEYNVATVNEIRAEQGKDPVPWGDNPPNPQRILSIGNQQEGIVDFERYQSRKKKRENGLINYTAQSKTKMKDGKNTEIGLPNVRTNFKGY